MTDDNALHCIKYEALDKIQERWQERSAIFYYVSNEYDSSSVGSICKI